MKLHVVTVGKPKLEYAQLGWSEYLKRLGRHHSVRTTHLPDKFAYDAPKILEASQKSYRIVLEIMGAQLTSPELSDFLEKLEHEGREISFIIGGPEGLPKEVVEGADYRWSLSKLTWPHDLAMVATLEALYRASTIRAGLPYHK